VKAPTPQATETLYATHQHGKLHIRPCSHMHRVEVAIEATADQIRDNDVCSWCARELAGGGRRYFDNLDDALRAFGHGTDKAHRLIREAIDGIEYDVIWIPSSKSYVGLGLGGPGVAWIGVGYVERKGLPTVELPWFVRAGGGGIKKGEEARGDVCEIHWVEKSVTGLCGLCG